MWVLCLCGVLVLAATLRADWTETNNDGGPGGLDQPGWVAAYNGSAPGPATNWYDAEDDLAPTWGTDPGWVDNVVAISDADATAYAAANQVSDFFNVRAYVAVSTIDPDEEFGAMVRANQFAMDDPPTAVTCYAATFNYDNAVNVGDPMEFKLYKIVNGVPAAQAVANPGVPAGADDYIVAIELTAVGRRITARLFEDYGDATPVAELSLYDYYRLDAGDTGVTALDYDGTAAIGALYDTLSSETYTYAIPGDLDFDFDVDADDIDLARDAIGSGFYYPEFDYDFDGYLTELDFILYVNRFPETPLGIGTVRGGFNLDGIVNATDLIIMQGSFGATECRWAQGNSNLDCLVNATDLQLLQTNYGYAGSAVPEPGTLLLLTAGAVFAIRRTGTT